LEHTILIPVDGTESVEETLLYLRSIVTRQQSRVVILHVTPNVEAAHASVEIHPNVNTIYDALSYERWDVKRETRMGNPVEEIVKMTVMLPATLVLMSTHGRSGLERIRDGSVTEQVLKQSPCPVFILHSTRPEPSDMRSENIFNRILVPLDGSEASSAILPCVEKFALNHNSEVIMFHDELEHAEYIEEKAVIKAKLHGQSIELANKGLKVSLDMSTYKRPIREILQKIDDMEIDLVSMVTHGNDGDRIAMDESVTAQVVRHSNCPLLVWSAEPQCQRVVA